MKFPRAKLAGNILAVLLLCGLGYYFRGDLVRLGNDVLDRFVPCRRPIQYSIASVDPKFGLTETKLLADIAQAEKIWEAPIGKQLFEYSATGDLKISLIYDYRQKATDELRKLGIVIHNDKSSYDLLKTKYDSLVATYDSLKKQVDSLVASYEKTNAAFNKDVAYWNDRGGAPTAEYDALKQRQEDLSAQVAQINVLKARLNALVDPINSTATVLNKLIAELNIQAKSYNSIGASTGKEFNEGLYTSSATGTAIDIFQFEDRPMLIRVMAHELGHALGLEHQDDPDSIMYRLNESKNDKLTVADLTALKDHCGIK